MFQEKVNELCQVMIQKEEISSEFRKTTLHMIYKGKGKHEDLSKNRFIHSKSWFPRLVEGLVVEGTLKEDPPNFLMKRGQTIDLGRRSPWWGGRKEATQLEPVLGGVHSSSEVASPG